MPFINNYFFLVCVATLTMAVYSYRLPDDVIADTRYDVTSAARVKRADDVNVMTLETLVQQQAAVIQQLQSRLTALENKLPTSFSPVGFSVRFSKDDFPNGLSLSPQATLRFDDVLANVGQGYDPQTGFFTAPVTGLYAFFLDFMSVNGQGQTYMAIVKHNVPLDVAFAYGSTDFDQGSTQVVSHVAAGEQIWVRHESGNTAVRGGLFTVFSGYLVQAD